MATGRDPAGPLPLDGTVAVVGASLAGLRAVEALRREGFTGRLVLIGAEPHLPYDRPPLSKQVLAGTWPLEKTTLADQEKLDGLGVEAHLGRPAVSLDAEARRVELTDGTVVEADGVVVATGAHPRPLPGTEGAPGVGVLRTLDDVERLRGQVLAIGPGCRVVVVGAGFIGSEVASTLNGLECSVTVVELLDVPLSPVVGEVLGAALGALHGAHGVELRTGVGVTAVHPPEAGAPAGTSGAAGRVELTDGTTLPADVVVVGIGVVPTVGWLDGSGLTVDNGVLCDHALFAADGVVAAGDLARWPHRGLGATVRIEHWQVAAEEGVAAARSLLAGRRDAADVAPLPYFWSDQYGVKIQVLGRAAPDDEVTVVDGSLDGGPFVAVSTRAGRLTSALAVSRPRQLMSLRRLVEAHGTLEEVRALLGA